jgi:hypothetical protein
MPIEVVPGSPAENVLMVKATGKLTGDDYTKTLEPALAAQEKKGDGLRVVIALDKEFEGVTLEGFWEDLKMGLSKFSKWKRCAVVTDKDWIETALRAFGWMSPGDVKAFEPGQEADAAAWAAAND